MRHGYAPGDYDQREAERVNTALEKCRAELPQVEAALLALPAAVAALEAERESLLVKAEQSPL